MRRLILAAFTVLSLAGCAGQFCAADNEGVQSHPDSRAPDPHKGH